MGVLGLLEPVAHRGGTRDWNDVVLAASTGDDQPAPQRIRCRSHPPIASWIRWTCAFGTSTPSGLPDGPASTSWSTATLEFGRVREHLAALGPWFCPGRA